MKSNEGTIDRVIRIIIAIALALLIYFEVVTGTWAIILGIVGAIALITGIIGWCGLYAVFGCSTCSMKKPEASGE